MYVPADRGPRGRRAGGRTLVRRPRRRFTHRDGLCSFEVLVEDYGLDDPALRLLARVSTERTCPTISTPHRNRRAPCGRRRLLAPGSRRPAQLELSLPVYDALYAWCKAEVQAGVPARAGPEACEPRSRRLHCGSARAEARLRPCRRLACRPAGSRMYVAHTGADRVDVIDCRTPTFLTVPSTSLPGVAGVLIDQEHDLLFTSDRAAGAAQLTSAAPTRLCSEQVDVAALSERARLRSHPPPPLLIQRR